jgi:hypothetical protein
MPDFISIKINGGDLWEFNIEDLEQAKKEIQGYIDSKYDDIFLKDDEKET